MPVNDKRLSKTIARALRHAPEDYGLELDGAGWVSVDNLLAALRARRREWRNLTENDLVNMMARAEKQRYELVDGRIRAYYGHSTRDAIQHAPSDPPPILYHGTAPAKADIILKEGLKSMSRQYVHLSTDPNTAQVVGARHAPDPIILEIHAAEAHAAGVAFYLGNEDVWLADDIPAEFIKKP